MSATVSGPDGSHVVAGALRHLTFSTTTTRSGDFRLMTIFGCSRS